MFIPPLCLDEATRFGRPGGFCVQKWACEASSAAMRSSSAHTSAIRPEITMRPAPLTRSLLSATRTTRSTGFKPDRAVWCAGAVFRPKGSHEPCLAAHGGREGAVFRSGMADGAAGRLKLERP